MVGRPVGVILLLISQLVLHSHETTLFSGERGPGDLGRSRVAQLHQLKSRLEKYRSSKLKEAGSGARAGNRSSTSFKIPTLSPLLILSSKADARNGFWSKFLPSPDLLKRLAKMRDSLEPSVKSFLTSKYNDFLTGLVPYSDSIGVPPFVLNSMKIPENFDPRWNYIKKLLETSSLDTFIQRLPDLKSMRDGLGKQLGPRPVDGGAESRSGDEFISDQEPHATSKGKRKYRLPTRLQGYRKAESELEGTGYGSYGSYGGGSAGNYYDQFGKGYEDYHPGTKDKLYEEYPQKGSSGKYLSSGYGETFGAGHSSYSTSQSEGHGHGGSNGHGLGGYLDPFSILGGLAFLVYLGLLFQQSTTNNGNMGRTEEDLMSPLPFQGPLDRTSRQERSLRLGQQELALMLKPLSPRLAGTDTDCLLLQYCNILKDIQRLQYAPPLYTLLKEVIIGQYVTDGHKRISLLENTDGHWLDCSLIFECHS